MTRKRDIVRSERSIHHHHLPSVPASSRLHTISSNVCLSLNRVKHSKAGFQFTITMHTCGQPSLVPLHATRSNRFGNGGTHARTRASQRNDSASRVDYPVTRRNPSTVPLGSAVPIFSGIVTPPLHANFRGTRSRLIHNLFNPTSMMDFPGAFFFLGTFLAPTHKDKGGFGSRMMWGFD